VSGLSSRLVWGRGDRCRPRELSKPGAAGSCWFDWHNDRTPRSTLITISYGESECGCGFKSTRPSWLYLPWPYFARSSHARTRCSPRLDARHFGSAEIVAGFDGWPVVLTVLLAGFGQGIAYPWLFNTTLGDVAPHQAGVAVGVLTSALQIGAAIGSLFFGVLGHGFGRDAYAHAFGIGQMATTGALPRRRRRGPHRS